MVGSCVPSEIWEPVGPCGVFWLIATHLASTVDGWGMELQHAHSKKRLGAAGGVRCVRLLFLVPLAVSSAAATREIWMLPVLGESLTYVKDPLSFFEEMVKASAACLVNCLVSSGYRCYRSCLLQILQFSWLQLQFRWFSGRWNSLVVGLPSLATGETHPAWWHLQVTSTASSFGHLSRDRGKCQTDPLQERFGMLRFDQ